MTKLEATGEELAEASSETHPVSALIMVPTASAAATATVGRRRCIEAVSAPELILASGSRYRRQQPNVWGCITTAGARHRRIGGLPGEAPAAMARRLAVLKAVW